jgi:hypothetical protein
MVGFEWGREGCGRAKGELRGPLKETFFEKKDFLQTTFKKTLNHHHFQEQQNISLFIG